MQEVDYKELYDNDFDRLKDKITPIDKPYYIHQFALKHSKENDDVLEVGCGFGHLAKLLVDNKRKYFGVDISDKSAKYCISLGYTCFQSDIIELPFPNNSFDCIVALEVIEHIPDVNKGIIEMIRVLKPGGKLIITTPIGYNFDNEGKSLHINHWNFISFQKFLLQEKVKILKAQPLN